MKRSLSFDSVMIGIVLIVGVVLRLRQYLIVRSLWIDEAMLALNIVNRDFVDLFKPLDYNQGAPIGFLLIEKTFNAILGRHELVLRLFPFIAGIISLWLFYLLAKQVTNQTGVFIALAIFAVNPQLIYYSSEGKQYIVDVAVTLAMLMLAMPLFKPTTDKNNRLQLALAGLIALWLSHPALFVLAGIGIALLVQHIQTRDYSNLKETTITGILWLINFVFLYLINLQNLRGNSFLTEYWAEAFPPNPLNIAWLVSYLSENTQTQLGMEYFTWLVLPLILAGWFMLYHDSRPFALTIALIALIAFTAMALQLYPVKERLALFTTPLVILLLGKATEFVQKIFSSNRIAAIAVTLLLSGCLLYSPLAASFQDFIAPTYFEHMRPYMDYLSASWKDDDVLFVSYWAEPAFQYYAPFYKLENIQYSSSTYEDYPNPQKLKARFDPLIGKKRVWVLFSHVYENKVFNERDVIIEHLDVIGDKIREHQIGGTSVFLYLYDLSK